MLTPAILIALAVAALIYAAEQVGRARRTALIVAVVLFVIFLALMIVPRVVE